MNVNGIDLEFAIKNRNFDLAKMVGKMWPEFTAAKAEDEEFFVYKNSSFQKLWEELGLVDQTYNTMIHFIPEGNYLTVVVDELSGEILDFFVDLVTSESFTYIPKKTERKLMFFMGEEISKEIDKEIIDSICWN